MELFLSAVFLWVAIPFCIGWLSMAPWVPTKAVDIIRFLSLINLEKDQKFLEVWCGDGRVSHAVAKKFPQASITGIEIALPVFLWAWLRGVINKQKNYNVRLANAFKEDFGEYDVIYVFGMPDKMWAKIVPKFLKEAKTWAKLYSYVFSIPEEYRDMAISHGHKDQAKIHILEKK